MKRASYRISVRWIACNVPGKPASPYHRWYPLDALTDSGRVAVDLVAALFGVSAERAAGDMARCATGRTPASAC